MHELITAAASMIIMCMFVMQFALSENLFLELSACERVISEYEQAEMLNPQDLTESLESIPNVSAEVTGGKVRLTIDRIVVPVWNEGDNHITLTREIRHEESYYDHGSDPSDEPPDQNSD